MQTTLNIGGIITVWLFSNLTSLASPASLHTNKHIISVLVKSNVVNLETRCKVILPPTGGGSSLISVTRLGDFLPFGQAFKACENNYFTQIALILTQFV